MIAGGLGTFLGQDVPEREQTADELAAIQRHLEVYNVVESMKILPKPDPKSAREICETAATLISGFLRGGATATPGGLLILPDGSQLTLSCTTYAHDTGVDGEIHITRRLSASCTCRTFLGSPATPGRLCEHALPFYAREIAQHEAEFAARKAAEAAARKAAKRAARKSRRTRWLQKVRELLK